MKKFNKEKYLKKFNYKRIRQKYAKYLYIILPFIICGLLGVYYAYSRYYVSKEQDVIKMTVGDFRKNDIKLNIYLDGKKVTEAPQKNSGYSLGNVVCNNGEANWSNKLWQLTVNNITERTKCALYFIESPKYEFDYTGDEQKVTILKSGYYQLETWGASGGNASSNVLGGYGGYSAGIVNLNKGDVLYINVGGSGTCSSGSSAAGGYNGGGAAKSRSATYTMCSGGGATHIAKTSGLLSTLNSNKDSILIVSGGGGGSSKYSNNTSDGGAGGGLNGTVPSNGCSDCGTRTGGSQTAGGSGRGATGSFGQGGGSTSSYTNGGGGGYYGGGGDSYEWGATGGSGYISNSLLTHKVMYCYNCTESNAENTKTVTTTCNEEEPTESCAKKGSGYVKITYIPLTIDYYNEEEKIENIPDKSEYIFKEASCDNSSNITWNYEKWNVDINDYQENDVCKIKFKKTQTAKIISQLDTTGKCPTLDDSEMLNISTTASSPLICSAPDNYGTTYYFRGASTNNYVYFANFYWRIIRVNGDDTVRVIYDGTSAHANNDSSTDRQIGTLAFNTKYGDNAYMGYMYGTASSTTYAATHANINDSTIKAYLDNWYETNLKGTKYEQYISDNIFCNNRKLMSGTGIGTAISQYQGYKNANVSLKCLQQNDSLTVNDNNNGTAVLKYPIGLITKSETNAAYGNITNSYLYTGNTYWTMTPADYSDYQKSAAWVGVFLNTGGPENQWVSNVYAVRPVLNLKNDILTNGDGTSSNPYHLS